MFGRLSGLQRIAKNNFNEFDLNGSLLLAEIVDYLRVRRSVGVRNPLHYSPHPLSDHTLIERSRYEKFILIDYL